MSIKKTGLKQLTFALVLVWASGAWATPSPQFVTNVTLTQVADSDSGGEVVVFTVSQPVLAGCPSSGGYVVRDPNVLKGALALLMTALVASRSVDFYLDGTCDSTTGMPNVIQVTVH
jgi:hypothetical protein